MTFSDVAKFIIQGYFDQYPDELEELKNSETEKNFQCRLYEAENVIKDELEQNKYEFDDLLTLFLRGEDEGLNNDFSDWFYNFSPDPDDIITYMREPETLIFMLICDNIDSYSIADVLADVYGIEPPKPPKPADNEIMQYINNFCLVHENISKADILRVLGGAKNE